MKDLSGTIKINFKNNLFKSIKNIFSKNPFHKCKKEKYIPERPLQKYIFYLWKGCSRSNKKMYLQKDPSKSVKKMYFGKVFSEQGQVLYLAFLFDFVNTFFFSLRKSTTMVVGGCGSSVWFDGGLQWRLDLLGRGRGICVCSGLFERCRKKLPKLHSGLL